MIVIGLAWLANIRNFALTIQLFGYTRPRLNAALHSVHNNALQFPIVRRALINDTCHIKPSVHDYKESGMVCKMDSLSSWRAKAARAICG